MKFDLPTKASQEILQIDAREVEAVLQGPALKLKPWPGATVALKDGRKLFIREARLDEVPAMLGYMKKLLDVDHDFYDIVGARVYSEILGWYRKRLKDPYTLVGLIDGMWSGFANGRLMNEDINISLHTMALVRGGRIGAAMYYAKAYYGFEILGNKEWWATYEIVQRLDALGPGHGSAFLPVAGCPARAGRRQGLLRHQEVLGPADQELRARDGRRGPELQRPGLKSARPTKCMRVPEEILV